MKKEEAKHLQNRTKRLNLRLTAEEYRAFEKAFTASRFHKKSDFIRAKIFSNKISDQHENRHKAFLAAANLYTAINKIGGNFNQLMHAINSFKEVHLKPQELQVIRHVGYKLEELQRFFEELEL